MSARTRVVIGAGCVVALLCVGSGVWNPPGVAAAPAEGERVQAKSYFFGQVTNLFADGKVDIVLSRGPTPSPFANAAGGFVSVSGRLVPKP